MLAAAASCTWKWLVNYACQGLCACCWKSSDWLAKNMSVSVVSSVAVLGTDNQHVVTLSTMFYVF